MIPRRAFTIAYYDLRMTFSDPMPFVYLIVTPLLVMIMTRSMQGHVLVATGYSHANGAEQAIPGLALLFSSQYNDYIGFSFFRERIWNTWDRLRASHASTFDIIAGKIAR